MLSAQQLVLYYLYALHLHFCKDVPRLVCGMTVHNMCGSGASGYECSRVFEWCQHQYHADPFWNGIKLPSQNTFMRMFDTYGITKNDTWHTIRNKLPIDAHVHMLSVKRHCQDMLDEIRVQIRRYRLNKALVTKDRMNHLNESRQTHPKVRSYDVLNK